MPLDDLIRIMTLVAESAPNVTLTNAVAAMEAATAAANTISTVVQAQLKEWLVAGGMADDIIVERVTFRKYKDKPSRCSACAWSRRVEDRSFIVSWDGTGTPGDAQITYSNDDDTHTYARFKGVSVEAALREMIANFKDFPADALAKPGAKRG